MLHRKLRLLSDCIVLQILFLGSQGIAAEKITFAHAYVYDSRWLHFEAGRRAALVQRPIHMGFDDEGALYVTDSSGNTDSAPAQLKDPKAPRVAVGRQDGDGVFDDSTVFAERVPFPEGILVHEGSVYVGAPPHIWKLRDTDGDHVADERTVWFDGGSIEGVATTCTAPTPAPDGYFYWCKGAFQPQSHVLGSGKHVRVERRAHLSRQAGRQRAGSGDHWRHEQSRGTNIQRNRGAVFERTFFDLSGPGKRDGILHAVYGGMYGKKNDRVLAGHPSSGGLLPILTQMGPAAPSGI